MCEGVNLTLVVKCHTAQQAIQWEISAMRMYEMYTAVLNVRGQNH